MRPRVAIGRKILQLGGFVRSLAVAVMRPAHLIEFSRRSYAREQSVREWASDGVVKSDLNPHEKQLLSKIPIQKGNLLLLGVGGGREAIPLARLGFSVTGVDFVPGMVENAKINAKKAGVSIKGLVQELSNLNLKAREYDVVWLSAAMYSSVPGRINRRKMLKRIGESLKPGGFFACQFQWDDRSKKSKFGELIKKITAYLTLGNLHYEWGDQLWGSKEFIHAFSSRETLQSEFIQGGFTVLYCRTSNPPRGEALLQKPVD